MIQSQNFFVRPCSYHVIIFEKMLLVNNEQKIFSLTWYPKLAKSSLVPCSLQVSGLVTLFTNHYLHFKIENLINSIAYFHEYNDIIIPFRILYYIQSNILYTFYHYILWYMHKNTVQIQYWKLKNHFIAMYTQAVKIQTVICELSHKLSFLCNNFKMLTNIFKEQLCQ